MRAAPAPPLWQNGHVASYRDRLRPELLRFPGLWRTRILIGAGLFLAIFSALLVWEFGGPGTVARWRELALLAILALWLLACWPGEIVCGPAGVEQRRWLGMGKTVIRWDEVLGIEERGEFAGLSRRLGLAARVIAVTGTNGVVRHTPRHPDPDRFLRECRMRMEEWNARQGGTSVGFGLSRAREENG